MAHSEGHGHVAEHDRRDILYLATGATGAIGLASAVWPLIDQMNASATVRALSTLEVDISSLEPGQQLTVKFLGAPVFIRRMSFKDIEEANATSVGDLPDQSSRNPNNGDEGPATLANRLVDPERDILVMNGVCTHLGCVPVGDAGEFGGWFCPCHGSHYDTAGRIRKGPAPENLAVPVANFIDENTLKLG